MAGGAVAFQGDQHTVGGYNAGPVPPTPVPLWLGSSGRRMLDATGRFSDGWISPLSTYTTPEAVPNRQKMIDEAALAAGRDPAAVRRIYNVVGAIGAAHRGPGFTRGASGGTTGGTICDVVVTHGCAWNASPVDSDWTEQAARAMASASSTVRWSQCLGRRLRPRTWPVSETTRRSPRHRIQR